MFNPTTTICAPATKSGGAIAIVRLSGPEAIEIASRIFRPVGSRALSEKRTASLTFGTVYDPNSSEVIDEALVSLFRAPHSYTGEDSVEFSLHGSEYIVQRVLQLLLSVGATTAEPGEFSKRAFLNGKMDLSQAEAVADLIASTTAASHRMAMNQLRGGFKKALKTLHDQLLHLTALLELELDFSDHEDIEFASREELEETALVIRNHVTRLAESFKKGNALKRGIPVAIVGETNAGKSTLLNALLGEERALVSDIHGTTRDTVEEQIVIGETLVRFIDTAGIRTTDDTVEQLGIQRTYEKMEEADLILWVVDATNAEKQIGELYPTVLSSDKSVMLLINKTDKLSASEVENLRASVNKQLTAFNRSESSFVPYYFSARNSQDITHLEALLDERIRQMLHQQSATDEQAIIVSNARHYEALTSALSAINRVLDGLHTSLSGDFVSQDLRECLHHLSSITGEITTDSVLSTIFSKFCIGK